MHLILGINHLKKKNLKVAFTGPESSGKSSVSQAVAEHFDAQLFPEYAREYLTERSGKYDFSDIAKIGIEQEKRRNKLTEKGLKIYDTEALVLYIWSTFKYKQCAKEVLDLLEQQDYQIYFLCSPKDIPWEEDPLREHPNERAELFEIYLQKLQEMKVNYVILEGTLQERVKKSVELIEDLLLSKGGFCF